MHVAAATAGRSMAHRDPMACSCAACLLYVELRQDVDVREVCGGGVL